MDTAANKRRRIEPSFKAKVALAAIKESQTTAQISSTYGVHSTQIGKWKKDAIAAIGAFFSSTRKNASQQGNPQLEASLFEKIGRLEMEMAWLKKKL